MIERVSQSDHIFQFLVKETNLGGLRCVLQPPPAQSMVQALELLYALGGMSVSHVFSYMIIGMLLVLFLWGAPTSSGIITQRLILF